MKLLRICLLVLLAVLLPVRGALAAAMVCAPAGGAVAAQGDPAVLPCHMDGEGDAQPQPVDATDQCNLCSASCSATPLLRDMPRIAEPGGLVSARYPDVPAAAPSFLSDGQERPPRSR